MKVSIFEGFRYLYCYFVLNTSEKLAKTVICLMLFIHFIFGKKTTFVN